MSFRNAVFIVGSPRPRVGKTLLARLLVDFHLLDARPVAAFDLGAGEACLRQFLPRHASAADLGDIKGQMAIFDRLIADDGIAKIVDVGHGAFADFVKVAREIGLVEEARRRSIAATVLFMITPDKTSVDAYAGLRRQLAPTALVPVHNEIFGPAQYRDKFPPAGAAARAIRLPLLSAPLRPYLERQPFSFADVGTGSPLDVPLDAHVELQRWTRRVFVEFRELELQLLLADLQSSIQVGW